MDEKEKVETDKGEREEWETIYNADRMHVGQMIDSIKKP